MAVPRDETPRKALIGTELNFFSPQPDFFALSPVIIY